MTKTMSMCGLVLLASMQGAVAAMVDPRGPIEYPGMKVLADEQGAQTPGYLFRNECQKPSPWQAKWIWTGQRPSRTDRFTTDDRVGRATVFTICGSSRYIPIVHNFSDFTAMVSPWMRTSTSRGSAEATR